MPGKLKAVLSLLRRTLARWSGQSSVKMLIDDYRPEHHYMRGPGPKLVSSKPPFLKTCKRRPLSRRGQIHVC